MVQWIWQVAKGVRRQASLNLVWGCTSVALDFAFIAATKHAIDVATHKSEGNIAIAACLLAAIMGGQVIAGIAHRWTKAVFGVRARNRLQQTLFKRLVRSDWMALQRKHTGDILNRLETDVANVVQLLAETLPAMAAVGIRLAGAFVFLYSMDAQLACAVIVILPLFILLSKAYVGKMRLITRSIRNSDSRIQCVLQEALQHKMVVKTMGLYDQTIHKLEEVQDDLRQQVKRRTAFSSFSAAVMNIGFGGCYLIAFVWGCSRMMQGYISYGTMMAFVQLVGQIQSPFREITRFIPFLTTALTAIERLMELEIMPKEKEGDAIRLEGTPGICAKNVCFSYPDGSRWVLHDFCHVFEPGSSTAILGETGAGKTTLIRLILGLVTPTSGKITLFNNEQETICSPLTRDNIVYVPQGNTLFSGSIRDNLLLGNPEASERELQNALRMACADFVFDLPMNMDSVCNEMGGGLSEGQAQRIAVARALLRPGNVLLLDEATSALDADTEKRLLLNLQQHTTNKTVLFITHRKEVLAHCTHVLQLKRI